jgi:hypothetical protein
VLVLKVGLAPLRTPAQEVAPNGTINFLYLLNIVAARLVAPFIGPQEISCIFLSSEIVEGWIAARAAQLRSTSGGLGLAYRLN